MMFTSHPPTVFAVGDEQQISGKEAIAALAAGYEAGIRRGIAAGTKHSTSGYHVTGTVGAVGGAVAAARALALDGERTTHAIGIGATQAAGLYSARLGVMAKRLHAGRASLSGVIAAYLAGRGFTGSEIAIEALVRKMKIFHDQALDAGGAEMRHAVNVMADLLDGQRLEVHVEQRSGSAEHPLSHDQIKSKFTMLARTLLPEQRIARICDLVAGLEELPKLSPLSALLSQS